MRGKIQRRRVSRRMQCLVKRSRINTERNRLRRKIERMTSHSSISVSSATEWDTRPSNVHPRKQRTRSPAYLYYQQKARIKHVKSRTASTKTCGVSTADAHLQGHQFVQRNDQDGVGQIKVGHRSLPRDKNKSRCEHHGESGWKSEQRYLKRDATRSEAEAESSIRIEDHGQRLQSCVRQPES